MDLKPGRFVYWTPRVLSIMLICFISLFSLDVFSPELTVGQMALGFFMHNIPTLVLIGILAVAWRREIVGAIAFALAGLLYMFFAFVRGEIPWYLAMSWSMILAGPAFLISALFGLNWRIRKKGH